MDRNIPVFFSLLRAGLWERDIDQLSLFPISDEDWNKIFQMARQQTVTGLIYRGISHLPDDMFPSTPHMVRLVAEIDRIEKESRMMERAVSAVFREFSKNNISAVLQKGQGAAILYEHPELRECGDIDLFFGTEEDRLKAEELMLCNGASPRRMPDGSTYVKWNGISLEFHMKLIDINSPKASGYVCKTIGTSGFEEVRLSSGYPVKVPRPELSLLMYSSHIMKHFMGHCIGLRQICDLARACYIFKDRYSRDRLAVMMEKTGLSRWNELICSFMSGYLGLPENCNISDNKNRVNTGKLLETVLSGGNFGFSGLRKQYNSNKIWRRKIETVTLLLRNFCYSLSIVPEESVWLLINLAKGQLR